VLRDVFYSGRCFMGPGRRVGALLQARPVKGSDLAIHRLWFSAGSGQDPLCSKARGASLGDLRCRGGRGSKTPIRGALVFVLPSRCF